MFFKEITQVELEVVVFFCNVPFKFCHEFFLFFSLLRPTLWSFSFHESQSVSHSVVWLCDPTDCSLPGSSVHGILQVRIMEWVAILFTRGSSWPRDGTQVSHIPGRFFTIWATREAHGKSDSKYLLCITHVSSSLEPSHAQRIERNSQSLYRFLDNDLSSVPLDAVVVQSLSHVQLFATPWTAAIQASLSFTTSLSLLKVMSIESVMLSNHLILCCYLLLSPSVFPSVMVFSKESAFCIRWPKYWSFSSSPSNEYSGLISFRIDWFDLLAV